MADYDNQSEGSKALDQREHNNDANAKRVIMRYQDPTDGEWYNYNPTTLSTYKTLLDDYTTTNVTYVGKAAIGSATSSAVWQIQKIDETTGMVITWGGTGAFDQVWDNRATIVSYS